MAMIGCGLVGETTREHGDCWKQRSAEVVMSHGGGINSLAVVPLEMYTWCDIHNNQEIMEGGERK